MSIRQAQKRLAAEIGEAFAEKTDGDFEQDGSCVDLEGEEFEVRMCVGDTYSFHIHVIGVDNTSGDIAPNFTPRDVVDRILEVVERTSTRPTTLTYDPASGFVCCDQEIEEWLPRKVKNYRPTSFGRLDAVLGLQLAIVRGEIDPEDVEIEMPDGTTIQFDEEGRPQDQMIDGKVMELRGEYIGERDVS